MVSVLQLWVSRRIPPGEGKLRANSDCRRGWLASPAERAPVKADPFASSFENYSAASGIGIACDVIQARSTSTMRDRARAKGNDGSLGARAVLIRTCSAFLAWLILKFNADRLLANLT